MTRNLYTIFLMLALLLSSMSLQAAVITGTSGSFPLDTATPIPVSGVALALFAILAGTFLMVRKWRYTKNRSM